MYDKAAGTTAGGGVLASTGALGGTLWMIIAAVTLIAVGAALWKMAPRKG